MAMLAEPRRRQKFSVNPRGTDWVNDESKFGQKLMERMGWSKGKGLGANEDGRQESVKVKFKDDNKGVGCTKNHTDNWIAHQDDFNNLLANLNNDIEVKKEETVTVSSLEANSKSSRKRVHYQKFTKGKDLSTRSVEDLNCIFGIKGVKVKKECKKSPEDTSECGTETNENNHGLISVTSSFSVQEYFAEKMAAKLRSQPQASSPQELIQSVKVVIDCAGLVKDEDTYGVVENISHVDDSTKQKSKKKKCKKSKKVDDVVDPSGSHETRSTLKQVHFEISDINNDSKSKQKKTKNIPQIDCVVDSEKCSQNRMSPKKMSKKNKLKSSDVNDEWISEATPLKSDLVKEKNEVTIVSALSDCKAKTKKNTKRKAGKETSECKDTKCRKKTKKNKCVLELENGDSSQDSCKDIKSASKKQVGIPVSQNNSKHSKKEKKRK